MVSGGSLVPSGNDLVPFTAADLDPLRQRPADRYLLAAAPENERPRRDPRNALGARPLGHTETKRVHPRPVIVNGDDLELVTSADAVQGAHLAGYVLDVGRLRLPVSPAVPMSLVVRSHGTSLRDG